MATIFSHSDARRFAINRLERQIIDYDTFNVIDAAKTRNVDQWLESQYARIAKREDFPTEIEAWQLGVTSLMAVCKLREQSAYKLGKAVGTVQVVHAPCATCNVHRSAVKGKVSSSP